MIPWLLESELTGLELLFLIGKVENFKKKSNIFILAPLSPLPFITSFLEVSGIPGLGKGSGGRKEKPKLSSRSPLEFCCVLGRGTAAVHV